MFLATVYLTPFTPSTLFSHTDAYMVLGSPKEKFELSVSLLFFLRTDIRIRPKINHIDKGENRLFANIAVSSFAQFEHRNFRYNESNRTNQSLSAYYLGAAIGTRKTINDNSYFQLFTSPQISLSYYRGLGGRTLDPANLLSAERKYEKFGLVVPDLSVPIGAGLRYRWLTVKSGFAITTTLGGEERHLNRGNALTDKIVVDSYNFPKIPFFMEIGFQF